MTSLEQAASACGIELSNAIDWTYEKAIIAKHLEAFAREQKAESINAFVEIVEQLKARLDHAKEQSRELLKDKERLEFIITTLLAGGTPLLIERLGINTIVSRQSIDAALDKAALAKGDVE